jgi:phage shock protein A
VFTLDFTKWLTFWLTIIHHLVNTAFIPSRNAAMDAKPTLEEQLARATKALAEWMQQEFHDSVAVDNAYRGRSPATRTRMDKQLAQTRTWISVYQRQIQLLSAQIAAARATAALRRLRAVAVWDDDTDREEFDAACADADAALAVAESA